MSFQPLTREESAFDSVQDVFTTDNTGPAFMLDFASALAGIKNDVAAKVTWLQNEHRVSPCLAAARVGNDPVSAVYVRNKIRA